MSLELTIDDLLVLELHRLDRLQSFFPDSLPLCLLHFELDQTLTIHCSEPWLVDELLNKLDKLNWYAWLIVGAEAISICYALEEIHHAATRKSCQIPQPQD